jgi:hypothetical protein
MRFLFLGRLQCRGVGRSRRHSNAANAPKLHVGLAGIGHDLHLLASGVTKLAGFADRVAHRLRLFRQSFASNPDDIGTVTHIPHLVA